MTSEARPATRIDGRGFQLEPHRCFACGELNEHGLRLVLHADETGCRTELALDARFEGWEGVAHGGILCTILDEVMAWAVIGRDVWGVTARMTVDFRRPVPVGRPLRAEGTVTELTRRLIRTEGRILDAATGDLLASGEGTYVAAPPERLAELKARYRLRPANDRAGWGLGDPPVQVDR
ncbi:MAG TPA: PaaI family thioesterase [Candidatus Sulfomarinibacteraceae bacterium]|nr:PaaI family thioesterase [Candidatus Sulfomarinibacteraceae bacterium]